MQVAPLMDSRPALLSAPGTLPGGGRPTTWSLARRDPDGQTGVGGRGREDHRRPPGCAFLSRPSPRPRPAQVAPGTGTLPPQARPRADPAAARPERRPVLAPGAACAPPGGSGPPPARGRRPGAGSRRREERREEEELGGAGAARGRGRRRHRRRRRDSQAGAAGRAGGGRLGGGGSRRPGRRGPAGPAASAERREEGAAQTKRGAWAGAAATRDPRRCPPASARGEVSAAGGRRAGAANLGRSAELERGRLAGGGAGRAGRAWGTDLPAPLRALGTAAAWPRGRGLPARLCTFLPRPAAHPPGRGRRQGRGWGPGPGRPVPGTGDPRARGQRRACGLAAARSRGPGRDRAGAGGAGRVSSGRTAGAAGPAPGRGGRARPAELAAPGVGGVCGGEGVGGWGAAAQREGALALRAAPTRRLSPEQSFSLSPALALYPGPPHLRVVLGETGDF